MTSNMHNTGLVRGPNLEHGSCPRADHEERGLQSALPFPNACGVPNFCTYRIPKARQESAVVRRRAGSGSTPGCVLVQEIVNLLTVASWQGARGPRELDQASRGKDGRPTGVSKPGTWLVASVPALFLRLPARRLFKLARGPHEGRW